MGARRRHSRAIPELTIETRVNGEERQRASTRELIYDLPAIVRAATRQLGRPLARGDVIVTGTPAGVGLRLSPLKRRVAAFVKDRFRKARAPRIELRDLERAAAPRRCHRGRCRSAGRVRTRLTV